MYLHLLDSTGGSARQPPRVAAVLNSRACRSAIMFGDILSERQCTQLLHELRVPVLPRLAQPRLVLKQI
jgi:DNA mismatch repair protein MLH3